MNDQAKSKGSPPTPGAGKGRRVGRPRTKPDYSAAQIVCEQMALTTALYKANPRPSLQSIAEQLGLNPIKVRKLLITAGVYESEIADRVNAVFAEQQKSKTYTEAVQATAEILRLSRASIASYLPYEKGVYFPESAEGDKISVNAERQRRYRAVMRLKADPNEENLWKCLVAFQGYPFKTYYGLSFRYTIHKGRNNDYTRELFIGCREKSKSLSWSSVRLAFHNVEGQPMIRRPKALGDIRGVSYIYGIFYRFGLIQVPSEVEKSMNGKD